MGLARSLGLECKLGAKPLILAALWKKIKETDLLATSKKLAVY